MDSKTTSLPSTSSTPASTSRTIPIQLTATSATKIPEVHIKEIPETDEISEVSEISQSVCHVIKIRKLNRPSSMYNNVETNPKNDTTKVDSNDSKKPEALFEEETARPSTSDDTIKVEKNDEIKSSIPPSEAIKESNNSNPTFEESPSNMSLQKEEEKEETDRIIPEPNLIGIKAVGIFLECEGPDNVTSEEEVSSFNAKADPPKESPQNPPSESGPPKSWIQKKRESLNSGSSQFDVSEIPLDLVDTNDANSDAFILESANEGNAAAKNDEVNVAVDKVPKIEDETSKPPKSPKTKVSVQIHSNTATSSETVMVADDDAEQKVVEPLTVIIQQNPNEIAAVTSMETKAYDFKIEPSHEVIEPQDIQITTFQVSEAVSTKQNNDINLIIEEAKIVKASEAPPEVEQSRLETESEQQLSPSHKADLIPHENMEDKIHVPKDRPKSAAIYGASRKAIKDTNTG
uniref:Uncharacterized protein n=1 Tax=Panagrolaimus superbus TaxID=310955 RepID=A0A914Z4I9_9BILA